MGKRLPSIFNNKKSFEPAVQPKVPYHLIGIEVEVERVADKICSDECPAGWTITEDGSLRNNGLEFVSKPFMSKYVHSMVLRLAEYLPSSCEFSSRTSVHVHFNVLDMTVDELKTAMALYVVFERSLFDFVGKDRDQNIYCQPVYNLYNAHKAFRINVPKWGKYSAMNLNSIQEKGTVEFRHMYGNCDADLLTTWVDLITRVFDFARGKKFEETVDSLQALSTSSAWHGFSKEVFGELSSIFERQVNFKDNMQQGVRFLRSVTFRAPENLFMEFLKSDYLKYRVPDRYRDWETDRKSTRLNSSHSGESRMPSSA